mmetsp:Transcript_10557/g.23387  ORF Transcript_10557/g.23387 Transcript_10557/m.23387 type:complete len:773 (+) Transcript_10557:223-2541(+)
MLANNIEKKMPSSPKVETPTRLTLDESAEGGAPPRVVSALNGLNGGASKVEIEASGLALPQSTSTSPATDSSGQDESKSNQSDAVTNNNVRRRVSTDSPTPPQASPPQQQQQQQLTQIQIQQQQQQQRRISSSLAASSQAVHQLFGESVGPCWGDFSCTHLRIRGRLYATSQAILFHTSLLGFERRICLLLRDVVEMELFRTTSIRIHTMDLETYIFKSFNDREQVLHLLNGLKILADRKQRGTGSAGRNPATGNRTRNDSDSRAALSSKYSALNPVGTVSSPLVASAPPGTTTLSPLSPSASTDTSGGGAATTLFSIGRGPASPSGIIPSLPSPHNSPNRRRAASDSIVRLVNDSGSGDAQLQDNETIIPTTRLLPRSPLHPIESSNELHNAGNVANGEGSPPPSIGGNLDDTDYDLEDEGGQTSQRTKLEAIWASIKQSKQQLAEVGLESLTLPCSMDEYHTLFLDDNARYPLDYYQKEYVNDTGVEITGWDVGTAASSFGTTEGDGDSGCCFHRTITFTHPIKNSMGIGPSSAETTRQQRLRRYAGIGMALENKTFVEGLPGADCFYIQDFWLLEPAGPESNETKLSVQFDVIFHKRSLFKNIIQKSVRKETKQWIAGYLDMVQSVLGDRSVSTNIAVADNCERRSTTRSSAITSVMENTAHSLGSTQEPTISSASSVIRASTTSNVNSASLEAPMKVLVEQVQLAYRMLVVMALLLLLLACVLGFQVLSMQQSIVDLRSDLLLVTQHMKAQQLLQAIPNAGGIVDQEL